MNAESSEIFKNSQMFHKILLSLLLGAIDSQPIRCNDPDAKYP